MLCGLYATAELLVCIVLSVPNAAASICYNPTKTQKWSRI